MFQEIMTFLNQGGTGILVTALLHIESFLRSRRESQQQATVDEYLEWLRRQNHAELREGQQAILDAISAGDEQAAIWRAILEKLLSHVTALKSPLSEILSGVDAAGEQIDATDKKVDIVLQKLEQLSAGQSALSEGQLAVSGHLLEALTAGIKGAGYRATLSLRGDLRGMGTLGLVWRLGSESPHMMLCDYPGGLTDNRLSLILNNDASISLRVFDGDGRKLEIRSPSYSNAETVTPVAVWHGRDVSLYVNGVQHGSQTLQRGFKYLGPVLFQGIDVTGELSADRVAVCGKPPGLVFEKDGVSHGSMLVMVKLWRIAHDSESIREFWQNPYGGLNSLSPEDVLDQCTKGIEAGNRSASVLAQRGGARSQLGEHEAACQDFDESLQLDPEASTFLARGHALSKLGRYREALRDCAEAISRSPRSSATYNQRAWLLATSADEQFRNGWQALSDARKACELSSNHRHCLDTLATAFAEIGDFESAVDTQKKALLLYPKSAGYGVASERQKALERLSLYEERRAFRDQ